MQTLNWATVKAAQESFIIITCIHTGNMFLIFVFVFNVTEQSS